MRSNLTLVGAIFKNLQKFCQRADFSLLRVAKSSDFSQATLPIDTRFLGASLGVVNFTDTSWPSDVCPDGRAIEFKGWKFDHIEFKEVDRNPLTYLFWRRTDDFAFDPIDRALDFSLRFDADFYVRLEEFYRTHRVHPRATEALVLLKDHEWRFQIFGATQPDTLWRPVFQWVLRLCYGIFRPFLLLLFVGILGSLFFRQRWMVPKPKEVWPQQRRTWPVHKEPTFSAFWYSISLVLPGPLFVYAVFWKDDPAKFWEPKAKGGTFLYWVFSALAALCLALIAKNVLALLL